MDASTGLPSLKLAEIEALAVVSRKS